MDKVVPSSRMPRLALKIGQRLPVIGSSFSDNDRPPLRHPADLFNGLSGRDRDRNRALEILLFHLVTIYTAKLSHSSKKHLSKMENFRRRPYFAASFLNTQRKSIGLLLVSNDSG